MSSTAQASTSGVESTRGMAVLRAGWIAAAVLSFFVLIFSIPGYLTTPALGIFSGYLETRPGSFADQFAQATLVASFLSAVISYGLAVYLFVKKSSETMGLFLGYYLLGHSLLFAGPIEMLHPYWEAAPWVNSFILLPFIFTPASMALMGLFPDGRFVPGWSRWLIPLSLLAVPISLVNSGNFSPLDHAIPEGLLPVSGVILVVTFAAAIYSQVYRYRKVSSETEKHQTKWVFYGILLWSGINLLTSAAWQQALRLPAGSPVPNWLPLSMLAWSGSSLILPLSLTIAITRYRLFEIDFLLSRTLIYGVLSACIVGLYALVVVGLGAVLQPTDNYILSLAAVGLIAVLLQPLRARLQRSVNRLIYGERDEPLTVLRRLGRKLEGSELPEDDLDGIVETIAQALRLPYVEIALRRGADYERVSSHGSASGSVTRFQIRYQGEPIGVLEVGARSPGERLGGSDHRILTQIADQTAAVAHAAQLTRDLQHSRARVLSARDEERRRLRRDLHDSLGPVLASQGLKIAAVDRMLENDPHGARQLLQELAGQNEITVAEIRRLVYALRPPELDQLGLVEAVRDFADRLQSTVPAAGPQLSVTGLEALGDPGAISPAVEVAAYRIACEALTNVVRHAGAAHCSVSIGILPDRFGNLLRLEVRDDGAGLAQKARPGVGFNSMRERADEVGGEVVIEDAAPHGVSVVALLPLGTP